MHINNEIVVAKSHEEWLALRQGIGGSDIATAAGLNPYESRYELWERKLGLAPAKEENEAMSQGHELEDAIAQMFSRHTGYELIKSSAREFMFKSKEKPWMFYSPDRIYWLDPNHHDANDWSCKGICECKSTKRKDVSEDNIPDLWYAQTTWGLALGNMLEAHVAFLKAGGFEFGKRHILLNEDVFLELSEIGEEFWCKNVGEKIPPVDMRASDIQRLYPIEEAGKVATAETDLVQLITKYHALQDEAAKYESEIEEIKDKVIVAIGSSEKLVTPDGIILATYKAPKATLSLDGKALKAAEPEVWQRYAIEKQGARRLLIK